MNVIVWQGWCSRCGAPVNDETMDLYLSLPAGPGPTGMAYWQILCKNTTLCDAKAKAKKS